MAEQVLRKLSTQFDINLNNVQQLRNGHNLILIAFKILYHENNDFLASKLSGMNLNNQSLSKSQLNESLISNQSTTTKPGNNVILINTLLKHIKSDKTLLLPNSIKQLTFYNILEEDQLLCRFIEWMMIESKKQNKIQSNNCESAQFQSYSNQNFASKEQNFQSTSSNHFKKIQIQSIKAKENHRFKTEERQTNNGNLDKQENELENLYFASNLKQKLNDSPIDPQPQNNDRIVRKGSFKLLKPKVMFSEQSNLDRQPKQLHELNRIHKKPFQVYEPDELKEISMIESSQPHISSNSANIQPNFDNQMSQLNDSIDEIANKKFVNATPSVSLEKQNHRKTVPKNLSKPPLYRSSIKNKQNLHTQQKTIEHKSKKKNFFNFENQSQQLVSGFNDETIKNTEQMKIHSKKPQLSQNKFSQIQKNQTENANNMKKSVQNFYDIDGSNVIEEDEGYNIQKNIQIEEQKINSNTVQSNFTNSSSLLKLKNHFLQKQLYTLDKQIQNQQLEPRTQEPNHQQNKSAYSVPNSQSKNESFSSTKRGSRKVSKIHIKQIEDIVKQDIVDWLTNIRIISGVSVNLYEVPQIFKNGVKFVQLCNHYIGRGRAIPYFNNPKKNAQIHSNFSKVFQYLRSFSNFPQKELLFAYQLFVPHPQEGSIWNLLQTIYNLFNKKCIKPSNSKAKDQSQSFQQQSRISSSRKGKQQYEQENGKNNLSNKHIEFKNNNGSSSSINKERSSSSFKNKSVASSHKQPTFSKPIEFVPFAPEISRHIDLVQQSQQPDEQVNNVLNINENGVNNNVLTQGYKQKYLRRAIDTSNSKDHNKSSKQFFSLQTPKKQVVQNQEQSFIGDHKSKFLEKSLINRSSSKKVLQSQIRKLQTSSHKLHSIRKDSSKNTLSKLSKVTLNMQMKVQRFISEQNLEVFLNNSNENNEFRRIQLLEDPIRNGILVNILFARLESRDIKYIKVPQSIQHCRLNYNNIFNMIKNKYGQQMFQSFQLFTDLVQQILKGEKNIFYAVAYQMLQISGNKKGQNYNSINMVESSSRDNYNDRQSKCIDMINMSKSQMIRLYCENPISWVRLLQITNPLTSSLKIRTLDDLYTHVSTSAFLFSLLQNPTVNMVYLNPQSVNEKQANLKKVMIYMIQMRILKKEDFINSHQIALKNSLVIDNLLQKLVDYTVAKEWSYIERNISSLRKILLKQSAIKKTQQTNFNNTFNSGSNDTGANSNPIGNYQNQPQTQSVSSTINMRKGNFQSLEGKRLASTQKIKDNSKLKKEREEFEVEIPWMRKLGFTNCSLNLNNGILLCRLISKLTRTNIKFNENISHDAQISKPQALAYIRKALKLIPGCRMDEIDVYQADQRKTLQIYAMIKDRFRTNYEMGKVVNVR